ncbi:MAG: MFS transporter [Actinomycetota bacterium]
MIRRWVGVSALGLLTITSYGSWFYAFGVLIEEIAGDTGLSTTILGLTYGVAQVITGIGAFVAGRLLDRFGGVGPFGTQAVAGCGLMFASTLAPGPIFAVLYAAGSGLIGATGFYAVTTTAAARLRPDTPDRAIAVLTLIGALSSPLYLPGTAWLLGVTDWRTAAQILTAVSAGAALVAASVTSGARSQRGAGPSTNPFAALRVALGSPAVRRMLSVYFAAGLAYSTVLVYQVPILTASGIALGTAGTIGGLRGFCQIFGRVGLISVAERVGAARLLGLSYVVSALGVAMLFGANVATGLIYGVVAGVALGASSPLQAMVARAQFDEGDLGLLMGLQGAALGVAGGIGPLVGGAMRDASGSWTPTLVLSVLALATAGFLIRTVPSGGPNGISRRTSPDRHAPAPGTDPSAGGGSA